MSILASLVGKYDRLVDAGEAPEIGFSKENFMAAIVVDPNGKFLRIEDLRWEDKVLTGKDKKEKIFMRPRQASVPASKVRGSDILANDTWDNCRYILGLEPKEEKNEEGKKVTLKASTSKSELRLQAFIENNVSILEQLETPEAQAVLAYLQSPEEIEFARDAVSTEFLTGNLALAVEAPGELPVMLHDIHEIREFVRKGAHNSDGDEICLVTGKPGTAARIHPKVKGVAGGNPTGTSLVSFNQAAYESYGHSQGMNAPISEEAAFAYTTALNQMLDHDSVNRIEVGNLTILVWAETSTSEKDKALEAFSAELINPKAASSDADETSAQTSRLRDILARIMRGEVVSEIGLDPEARLNILGLAPNAGRVAVAIWHPDTLKTFVGRIQQFADDVALEPSGWRNLPSAQSVLAETAIRVKDKPKYDTINPLLGRQLLRSILTGSPYPRQLLPIITGRIKADGRIGGRRVGIIKAVLNRHYGKEKFQVTLDDNNTSPAYLCGRLFALYEAAQRLALGDKINATIKDRWYTAAMATPARVFPSLDSNSVNHVAVLRKQDDKRGLAVWIERSIAEVISKMPGGEFPRTLSPLDQGEFTIGYYQQAHRATSKKTTDTEADDTAEVIE